MIYYHRGLRVTMVQGDLEFKLLEEEVKELPCVPQLDIAAKEEHVGNVERNIWYLKEKFWQLRHTLPFWQIPGVIIVRMVQVCTMTLNMFPQKGKQLSLLTKHDCDRQRSVYGSVANQVRFVRPSMGAINSDKQHEYAATRRYCVRSVNDVDEELFIFGIGHR